MGVRPPCSTLIEIGITGPAEAVQSWSGSNRIERRGREYTEGGGGGSGGMVPREILKISFSMMHIWRILTENLRKNEQKLTVKTACVQLQTVIYRYPKCVD